MGTPLSENPAIREPTKYTQGILAQQELSKTLSLSQDQTKHIGTAGG